MDCLDLNAISIWKIVSCGTLEKVNGLAKEQEIPMVQNTSVVFWVYYMKILSISAPER